ncbi:MAG: pinensin family lanthipeptide [Bacteroidetes bacterium]|nr:pinensin family lanthipeptide [Bacteroidota bacterium]
MKKKLNLQEIKVESFVTDLSVNEKKTIYGADTTPILATLAEVGVGCLVGIVSNLGGCTITATIILPTNSDEVTKIMTECGVGCGNMTNQCSQDCISNGHAECSKFPGLC